MQEPYVETEGSGAAGCYDDEDCYQDEYSYYYEGSGSGEDSDEKPQQPAKVSFSKKNSSYHILAFFGEFFRNVGGFCAQGARKFKKVQAKNLWNQINQFHEKNLFEYFYEN